MSKGLVCNNCGAVVTFDGRGGSGSVTGEESAWIRIEAASQVVDACTRSCAIQMLADDGPLRPLIDQWLETISEIAHAINDEDESR